MIHDDPDREESWTTNMAALMRIAKLLDAITRPGGLIDAVSSLTDRVGLLEQRALNAERAILGLTQEEESEAKHRCPHCGSRVAVYECTHEFLCTNCWEEFGRPITFEPPPSQVPTRKEST